ncbi:uncharacterized protein BDW70DRAFT_164302 [Aspergillus foveolatus]|uniref:uncharacterized protein n=1 Tax=Aspergillus foveolatus TaxID=210207 RepID=UPI003CCD5030
MRFDILSVVTSALVLATCSLAFPAQPSPSDAVITINGALVSLPVEAANALQQAFASAYALRSDPGLVKRQDLVNPAPATAETGDESDVSPDGQLQICFEHWGFRVCYTTGKP